MVLRIYSEPHKWQILSLFLLPYFITAFVISWSSVCQACMIKWRDLVSPNDNTLLKCPRNPGSEQIMCKFFISRHCRSKITWPTYQYNPWFNNADIAQIGFQYVSHHKLTLFTEIKRIIREYYEQNSYANQLDNLDKIGKFLETWITKTGIGRNRKSK